MGSLELTYQYPFVYHGNGSSLRIASLCLSGAFRALCGVVAGGSKTALTVHFATSGRIPGDIGDLNAKDASKETVLALLGMLVSLYHLCGCPRRIGRLTNFYAGRIPCSTLRARHDLDICCAVHASLFTYMGKRQCRTGRRSTHAKSTEGEHHVDGI